MGEGGPEHRRGTGGVRASLGRSEHPRGAANVPEGSERPGKDPSMPEGVRVSPGGSPKIVGGTEHPRGTPASQMVLSIERFRASEGDPDHRGGRLSNIPRGSSIPGGHEHPRRTAPPPSPHPQLRHGCSHRGAGAELPEKRRRNRGRREATGSEGTARQCHRPSAERTEQVSG